VDRQNLAAPILVLLLALITSHDHFSSSAHGVPFVARIISLDTSSTSPLGRLIVRCGRFLGGLQVLLSYMASLFPPDLGRKLGVDVRFCLFSGRARPSCRGTAALIHLLFLSPLEQEVAPCPHFFDFRPSCDARQHCPLPIAPIPWVRPPTSFLPVASPLDPPSRYVR